METQEIKLPNVRVKEITPLTYNFFGKRPGLLGNKQVIFEIECSDGFFVVYISPLIKKGGEIDFKPIAEQKNDH